MRSARHTVIYVHGLRAHHVIQSTCTVYKSNARKTLSHRIPISQKAGPKMAKTHPTYQPTQQGLLHTNMVNTALLSHLPKMWLRLHHIANQHLRQLCPAQAASRFRLASCGRLPFNKKKKEAGGLRMGKLIRCCTMLRH